MKSIQSLHVFEEILKKEDAVLVYFSTDICSVCKVLKPKVSEMIGNMFPEMKMVYIQSDQLPEVAAQNRVFAAPTIIVFFAGRETIRKSRAFGVDELRKKIERPYSMMFEE
jgi:thioredoxin-like negative regulator of GroEL